MKRLAGPEVLVALALAVHGFLLLRPGSVATPHSDLAPFHLVRKQALYDSLRAGRGVPLWQEDQLSGEPAFTDPQAQFFMPLEALFWVLPPARAIAPTCWLLLLCAGLGVWALGGEIGLSFWPRLGAASAMLFSPKLLLVVYAGWLAHLPTLALLPFFFAATLRLSRAPCGRNAAWAALIGGLFLASGMVQTVYYALFFAAALVLARGRPPARAVGWLSLAAALGFGLAAFQLVPFLAEKHLFYRQQLSYADFLNGHGKPRSLFTLIWPDALGTQADTRLLELWEDSAHLGYAVLALALLALWRPRAPARLFAVFLAVTLLLGIDTPLLHAAYDWVPGMSLFRVPSRLLFVGAVFGACLAGLGLEKLPRRWAAAAIALMAGQCLFESYRLFSHSQPEALEPRPDYAQLISGDDHRVASIGRHALIPGWAAVIKARLISGYGPLSLRHYQRYFELLRHGSTALKPPQTWTDLDFVARWDLLDELGVRWVVAEARGDATPPHLVLEQWLPDQPEFVIYSGVQRRDLVLYRNPTELPLARLVSGAASVSGEDAAVEALQGLDARKTAVVEGKAPPGAELAPGETASIESYRPGALTIAARAARDRLLLVSEVWHPGWSATLDGQPAKILKADVALMGVVVPAGDHRVALSFLPLHLWPSVCLTALSALICLALALRPPAVLAGAESRAR